MHNLNDPSLRSFIDVAPTSAFPIQNLPFGVFRRSAGDEPRVGIAIGDWVLDLKGLSPTGLLKAINLPGDFFAMERDLHDFMARGQTCWREVRRRVSELLRHDNP